MMNVFAMPMRSWTTAPQSGWTKGAATKGRRGRASGLPTATELFLGLIDHHDKPGKSIEQVGAELRDRLESAEQNIRVFLAVKAVLDTAVDVLEMDVPVEPSVLAGANMGLQAFITLYNLRLEELKESRQLWESGESRLEKTLKTLPAIKVDRLRPSPDSLKQLKGKILDDARGEEWLWTKAQSLECGDGINLKDVLGR